MGNRFKLRKSKEPGIQSRISAAYARYAGSLPAHFGTNQDALTAKITCEGSIEVALGLLEEAREKGNHELAAALVESLAGARERLNGLDLRLEVTSNGRE